MPVIVLLLHDAKELLSQRRLDRIDRQFEFLASFVSIGPNSGRQNSAKIMNRLAFSLLIGKYIITYAKDNNVNDDLKKITDELSLKHKFLTSEEY